MQGAPTARFLYSKDSGAGPYGEAYGMGYPIEKFTMDLVLVMGDQDRWEVTGAPTHRLV